MSVIIKGLNKFYSCRLCPFNNSDCYCNITKGKIDRDDYFCESECPIVQLPKGHGRLIDADAKDLQSELWTFTRYTGIDEAPYEDACLVLDKAPTIIEADGGE